jgi:hypothetical protein
LNVVFSRQALFKTYCTACRPCITHLLAMCREVRSHCNTPLHFYRLTLPTRDNIGSKSYKAVCLLAGTTHREAAQLYIRRKDREKPATPRWLDKDLMDLRLPPHSTRHTSAMMLLDWKRHFDRRRCQVDHNLRWMFGRATIRIVSPISMTHHPTDQLIPKFGHNLKFRGKPVIIFAQDVAYCRPYLTPTRPFCEASPGGVETDRPVWTPIA